jgi:hypothetical protein
MKSQIISRKFLPKSRLKSLLRNLQKRLPQNQVKSLPKSLLPKTKSRSLTTRRSPMRLPQKRLPQNLRKSR